MEDFPLPIHCVTIIVTQYSNNYHYTVFMSSSNLDIALTFSLYGMLDYSVGNILHFLVKSGN